MIIGNFIINVEHTWMRIIIHGPPIVNLPKPFGRFFLLLPAGQLLPWKNIGDNKIKTTFDFGRFSEV